MPIENKARRNLVTIVLIMSTIMVTVDSTVANVVLPHMQGSLNASRDQIAWVITSYAIASAISLSLTGFLAERFGPRRLLILGISGFAFASLLCSGAQTMSEIVIYRILQGICGAWLVPLSQSMLMEAYPREQHTKMLAMFSMVVMLGVMIGPSLGGYLTEYSNWRLIFLINLPLSIPPIVGAIFLIRESQIRSQHYFDGLGFILLAVALAALQLMLDRGQTLDWFESMEIIVEAIVTVGAFYLFVVHILTTPKPFLSLALFRDRNFSLGLLLSFFNGAVPSATMVLLPILLQTVMGYPVKDAGAILATRGVGTLVALWITVRGMELFGTRVMLVSGILTIVVTMAFMSGFTTDTPASLIVFSGFFQGLGLGMLYMPMVTLVFATMEQRFVTEATAICNLGRNIGGSIGVSLLVTFSSYSTQVVHSDLTEHINAFSRPLQELAADAVLAAEPGALIAIHQEIERQAAMTAYVNDFHLLMLISLAMAPLMLLFRVKDRPGPSKTAPAMESHAG